MPKEKPKYIAVNGMNLGDPKGKRVEPGEPLPDGVKPETIKDLLEHGDIREDGK